MASKLKWTVGEAPTGAYKSFFKRGWPMATIGDKVIAHIHCEDSYVPALVRSGDHKELTIRVAKYADGKAAFEWKQLKTKAATLDEAKAITQRFVDANPAFFCLTAA